MSKHSTCVVSGESDSGPRERMEQMMQEVGFAATESKGQVTNAPLCGKNEEKSLASHKL